MNFEDFALLTGATGITLLLYLLADKIALWLYPFVF